MVENGFHTSTVDSLQPTGAKNNKLFVEVLRNTNGLQTNSKHITMTNRTQTNPKQPLSWVIPIPTLDKSCAHQMVFSYLDRLLKRVFMSRHISPDQPAPFHEANHLSAFPVLTQSDPPNDVAKKHVPCRVCNFSGSNRKQTSYQSCFSLSPEPWLLFP